VNPAQKVFTSPVVAAPFGWVGAVVDHVVADCVLVQPPRINSRETAAQVTAVVPLVTRMMARLRLETSTAPCSALLTETWKPVASP
jgi:hypothetical protein